MDRCPSCSESINPNSKFCNACGATIGKISVSKSSDDVKKRSYKLRSPILESAILYENESDKNHSFLTISAYGFWIFALAFVIYGVKTIYATYTSNLFDGIVTASFLFAVALLCFIIPGVINLLVDMADNLSVLSKEAKKDKMD